MSLATTSEKQIAELKPLLEKLYSKQPHEKEAAQAAINRLGANKLEVLLALLQKEAADRRKRRHYITLGFGAYVVFLLAMIVVPMLLGEAPKLHFLKGAGVIFWVMLGLLAVSAAQKNATRALGEFDDKQTVGWWAAALEYDDKEVAAMARQKLLQLLPQLNASDTHLMDDEQRECLYNALNKRPDKQNANTALHQAILKALQQIGDEKALPHVEKLAKGEGLAERYPALKADAEECLPFLKERVEQQRASQTLLRASSAADALSSQPDILLRPALDAGVTAPEELLRASDADPASLAPVTLPQSSETPMVATLHRSE